MQINNLNNGGTMALAKAGLADGTTSTYTTTKAVPFIINNIYGTELGVKTNAATPTVDHATGLTFVTVPKSKGCIIVYGVIAAGTIVACQGGLKSLDAANKFVIDPSFPSIPDTMCPFGYRIVENGSTGADWVFGVGAFDATGIVSIFADIGGLPHRPVAGTA